MDPQSWNRYAYVNNSPINFSDPTGHIPEGECSFVSGCDPIDPPDPEPQPDNGNDGGICIPCITGSTGDVGSESPIIEDDEDNPTNGPSGFPTEIGYRIPSVPLTTFPIDIWLWRWTTSLDFNLTHQTPSTITTISADGFIVGDGKISPKDLTLWLPNVSTDLGPYSLDARWGVKASWDSVKLAGRTTVSYTQGNNTLNIRQASEFEYRPRNNFIAGGALGVSILAPELAPLVIRKLSEGGAGLCPGPLCQ